MNKKRAKQTTRLANGDIVRIPPIRTAESEAPPKVSDALAERLSRTLIYEDEHLFIINKPAGLAVHGGSGVSLGLIEALRVLYPEERELELVHRLDRDTSGCIMVARRRSFLRRLQRLMQQGGVEKRYWLLCQGFKGKERRIEAPLLKLMQGNERVVRVSREGKPSVTDFRLLERLGGVSLVEATLGTGRTHQIRVHSQFGGFALLGDDKYGNDQGDRLLGELGMRRLCLHAHSLTFRHPLSERRVRVEAPLDEDFESILAALRRRSRS